MVIAPYLAEDLVSQFDGAMDCDPLGSWRFGIYRLGRRFERPAVARLDTVMFQGDKDVTWAFCFVRGLPYSFETLQDKAGNSFLVVNLPLAA